MSHYQLASVLILISGCAHAIVSALLKAGKDKVSGRAMIDGFSALFVVPAAFFVPLPAHAWGWLAISWIIHIVYLISLVKAFEKMDMTVAYPIARGIAPVLAATGAVLLFHEPITLMIAAGILMVSGGVLAVGLSHKVNRRAIGWSMLNGCCIAVYTIVDAQGVRAAPTAGSYIVWTFLLLGSGIGALFAWWRGREFVTAMKSQWKPGVIAGALSIVTYGLALLAFRWGATPRLAALRETSILFATVIAVVFLKERLIWPRVAGVFTIGLGAMLLLAQR